MAKYSTDSIFKLGLKHKKYETYLMTFLSCWLYAFVFTPEEGNIIRIGTFKIISLIVSGKRFINVVLVLANIYHDLN